MTVELLVGAPAGQVPSPQQRRLALLGVDQPHEPFRTVCVLRADLAPEGLRAVLAELSRRHPILGGGFRLEVRDSPDGGDPIDSLAEELRVVDLAGAPYARFDPSRGLLGLALPALMSDIVGLFNVAARIAGAGTGSADGEAPLYSEVAEILNDLLAAEDAEGGRDRWRREAWAGFADLSLPLEERSPGSAFRPAVLPVEVPAPLGARAGALGVAPADLLLAAWLVLLRRLTGERDLVVGLTCDGRDYPGLEGVIGPLARVLPLLFQVEDDTRLPALLEQIAERSREAREWQDYFVWDEPEWLPYSFAAVVAPAGILRHYACLDRFRAQLSCSIRGAEVTAELAFDPAVLPETEASRLAGWLSVLLSGVVEHPGVLVVELEILSAAERRQLLVTWNDTAVDYPGEEGLHELVRAQAARTPDRVAVESGDECLTFSELVLRAQRLARTLRRLGAGPERTVAVCAERSLEMVVALLAVLEAGGAYVPLDPDYPAERLGAVLRGSGARILLAQEHLVPLLPEHEAQLVLLGEEEPGECLGSQSPLSLAYVIYTSGSTGEPKGVMVSHRAIRNRLLWIQAEHPLGAHDRLLQKTPFGFDASIWELFVPLLAGARLVLAPPGAQRDPRYLVAAVAERGITVLQLVPSMLRVALEEPGVGEGWKGLRRLYCGGEALPRELQERFFERLPGVRLHNLYGPTETAIDAAHRPCAPGEGWPGILIGRPIGNLRLYVTDDRLRLLPAGVPGELCIGGVEGAGLARGYLGRPDLTAERFVPDPFSSAPGERLYRSGDLARLLPDGTAEFLGRRDHQIKLRGFRIELGEVEAALARHPALAAAVVLAREDVPGEPRLVAYVVAAGGVRPEPAELAGFLAPSLPGYMVPAAFVLLPRLPLLPNGKLDRASLPPPSVADFAGAAVSGSSGSSGGSAGPRTPTEELLAELWKDLLGLREVGAHDDFFRLGGQSLLATRLVARAREAFGIDLSLRQVFEAPTLAGLAEAVEAARRAGDGGLEAPPLERVPRQEGAELPLSFAQQRLWFLDQLEPGSAVYNLPLAVRLAGRLDAAALAGTLGEIVRRHEALRTRFVAVDGRPVQVIDAPPAGRLLPRVDLAGLPAAIAEPEVARLAREEVAAPFDLARGPLLRALLVRLAGEIGGEIAGEIAGEEHALLATLHHIVSDGWSTGVLTREIASLYSAFVAGRPSPLPELPIQYADFAAWQRRWLTGAALERQLDYWRGRLAGSPPALDLPFDRPRPPVPSFRGTRHGFLLAEPRAAALSLLGRREGATPFMTLMAAFQALLHRYSGQDDVLVGTPVANRTRPELEALIGFFVNTLVLRADLSGNPSFRRHLAAVREAALGAWDHQDIPFEHLVEALQPARDTSHNPLFQVMLALQNAPVEALELPGLELRPQPMGVGTAKFDLTLQLTEFPGGIFGSIEYDVHLFDAATIARLARHFVHLIEEIGRDATRGVDELEILDEAERRQVLLEWNDTELPPPDGRLVHEVIAGRAAESPGATAVAWSGGTLTYAGLVGLSAALAHHLRGLGVGPEVPVAVCAERSPDLVVAALAVLLSGGAYLPLDPSHPPERLRYTLEDAGNPLLLTQIRLLPLFPEGTRSLLLDAPATGGEERGGAPGAGDWQRGREGGGSAHEGAEPGDTAPLRAGGDHLAYVIYTSGSTGRPKGTLLTHRGFRNMAHQMAQALALGPGARLLQFSSPSFDAAVCEIFSALTAGAELHLAAPEEMLPGPDLVRLLRDRAITSVILPPSALRISPVEELPALGTLMVAGEACPPDLVAVWGASRRFLNGYGPTEATVCASIGLPEPADPRPPIGRNLANVRLYVLGAAGQPAAIGIPGELHIAGIGLARGYLGRPELTAERFLPDPFSTVPGGRLYRTGDRVRRRTDGQLEFLGRTDYQVKVRGFRIEIEEVEAVLGRQPGLREAAVAAREDASGGYRLIGYVVPETPGETPGGTVNVSELRASLRRELPDYMIPTAWVTLESLPLTTAGKVDRRALPAPAGERPGLEAGYVAPRGPVEEALAGIWSRLLGIERVGAHDDFFELGGHSLLATQVVSRVRTVFQVELPLRDFFAAATVAKLADRIRRHEAQGIAAAASTGRIGRRDNPAELPLSFAQQRLWFLDQWQPGTPTYNISSAFHLAGPLRPDVLARALAEIVRRHEVLRSTIRTVDGRAVQELTPPGPFLLPVIDLEKVPEEGRRAEAAARLVGEEARRPFDLAAGPLLRAAALRLDAEEHLLVLLQHHIVSDGWSMGILVREVVTLYEAFAAGRPSPLPELPLQYADFAAWQRRRLRGEALDEMLGWWRERLAGVPDLLDLPTDRPRPPVQGWAGSTFSFALPAEPRDGLDALARREGATLFMALLAAFAIVLQRYSGRDDVVVGSPIANRNRDEVEGLVGFFVNTLALRADLSGDPTFRELLARVRETTLGAYDHQDIPFEMLVDELGLSREVSHTPLFQVTFALQNAPAPSVEVTGLALAPLPAPTGASKFDLSLAMTERPGGLAGFIDYRTDLFDRATVERLAGHLGTLLEEIARDPDRRLSDLSLLTPEERRQAGAWSAAAATFPVAGSLHRRFEEQVVHAPRAEAVTGDGERLTYAELDARASRLASRLRALGAGPESRVCLLAERTPALVVGVLGILKAGGAYVPLDPAHPDERLAFMARDCGASLLVAGPGFEERLAALGDGLQVVALEDGGEPGPALAGAEVDPEQAAYVIYTSGSTGRPKGVVVTHGNVLRLFAATEAWFGFGPDDVWTLFHSYAFDFSVWEIWGALLHGGRLVVVPYLVSRSPDRLLDLLDREQVTVLNQTPSAFRQLVQAEGTRGQAAGLSLRRVIFGGEALDFPSLAPWFDRHGDERPVLVNLYGITETTVHVTYRPVRRADLAAGRSLIGRAIPDLSLHVLDPAGAPAPIGVPGEICVGGAGLARGYLGRPELTAQRFVPAPAGARLYRSGDLARRRSDGDLEYLGRIDQQVKIRGFRIELGEIEAALAEHPAVREAVVLPREERGEKRLVAYVVPAEPGLSIPALRDALRERLPDSMVPAAWVTMAALPLTPNGKLDRAALPAPEPARRDVAEEYAAPDTPAQELLATVWAQVLGLDRVGIHDNFFALGGDSILSIQVISLARERGLELTLQELFQHQTVAELAAALAVSAGEGDAAPRAGGEPVWSLSDEERARLPEDVEDAYPLTHMQSAMLFYMALTPEEALYLNVNSWHLQGALDLAAFQQAVDRVVARHPILRTSFDLFHSGRASEPLQRVHRVASLPVGFEDLRHLAPGEQEREIDDYVRRQRGTPFDLTRPPQLRFHIHRRSDDTYQFTLTENHAILDGWSLHSTLTEIFRHYSALLTEEPAGEPLAPEPPPAVSYRDFVLLELAARRSAETRGFWAGQLAGAPFGGLPRWPGRRTGGSQGGSVQRLLPPALLERLRDLARQEAVPLKSVLLAAHLRVMALAGGREDVVTGLVVNGRPESRDGEQVRGLFLNSVPLRLDTGEAGSWRELVRAAFRLEWEMLPHRRYPLATIQADNAGGRDLFEIGFNYIHFHVVEAISRSGGLAVLARKRSEGNNLTLMVNFDQTVTGAGGLLLGMDYNAAELARAQVETLASFFLKAFTAMAEEPDADPAAADLLGEAARHQLLVEWSGSEPSPDHPPLVHRAFAHQAAISPQAIALLTEAGHLTYADLHARVQTLARRLTAAGAGPERVVGVCLERSFDLIAALLATLEAGAAYLPLDPNYPTDRLAAMLEDAGAVALITRGPLQDRLPRTTIPILDLDPAGEGEVLGVSGPAQATGSVGGGAPEDSGAHTKEPSRAETPQEPSGEEAPAYIMYTSGSTGRPKGVIIRHRSLAHYTHLARRAYDIRPDDRVLQFASIAFDTSAEEIYPSLTAGATLVLRTDPRPEEAPEFFASLARLGVTVLDLPTSYWHELVAALDRDPDLTLPPALRLVILGGERALPARVAAWQRRVGDAVRLVNSYGPTETTIVATHADLSPGSWDPATEPDVPIGRPIPGARVFILDRRLRPLPAGVFGELCVGGAGLARGYLGQPDRTAERFIPAPFGGPPGARLYRTGDLARFRPDGALEFGGRVDEQVKVRGVRVEPGEVEAVLAAHPALAEAAVAARPDPTHPADPTGGFRLIAWIVPQPGQEATVVDLRAFLLARLPEAMIPAAFVTLPALPRLPNGKIDRRGLPEATGDRPRLGTEYVAPDSGLERAIADVWRDLLRVEKVGLHDNFFDLGGHSLLLIEAQRRLREALRRDIAVTDLFRFPTVGLLARHLGQGEEETAAAVRKAQDLGEKQRGAARSAMERQRQAMAKRKEAAKKPNDRGND